MNDQKPDISNLIIPNDDPDPIEKDGMVLLGTLNMEVVSAIVADTLKRFKGQLQAEAESDV